VSSRSLTRGRNLPPPAANSTARLDLCIICIISLVIYGTPSMGGRNTGSGPIIQKFILHTSSSSQVEVSSHSLMPSKKTATTACSHLPASLTTFHARD
jgi:hypothetical protein